jgi:hypothetical protein
MRLVGAAGRVRHASQIAAAKFEHDVGARALHRFLNDPSFNKCGCARGSARRE